MAGIAASTGAALGVGVVAGVGVREVYAEGEAFFDDLGFGEVDEGAVDFIAAFAFDAGLGGEVCEGFKGGDEFGAAVGVAGVVDGVDADEEVEAFGDFGEAQGVGEEDGVACGDVGDGYAVGDLFVGFVEGYGDVGGEGGAAEGAEVDARGDVAGDALGLGLPFGAVELEFVALAIVKGDGVKGVTFLFGDGQDGGGIKPAGEEDDGIFGRHGRYFSR